MMIFIANTESGETFGGYDLLLSNEAGAINRRTSPTCIPLNPSSTDSVAWLAPILTFTGL